MKEDKKYYTVEPNNHNDWLEERRKGIGSSEISVVLGLRPFKDATLYKLWRNKVYPTPEEETEIMLNGHLLEDAVARWWSIKTGNKLIEYSAREYICVSKENDIFRASPDRIFWVDKNAPQTEKNKGVLECKTTQIYGEEMPEHWKKQVTWIMGVTGYKTGWVAWLNYSKGLKFYTQKVEFDSEEFERMKRKAEEFWNEYVIPQKEPELETVQDIKLRYPEERKGGVCNLSDMEYTDVFINMKAALEKSEYFKQQAEVYKNYILANMKDCEYLTDATANIIATWKKNKDTEKFDAKSFAKDYPELYQKYLKTIQGARVFRMKI